jgi:hypothetical protein
MVFPSLHVKTAVATGVSASAGNAISAATLAMADLAKLERIVIDPFLRIVRRYPVYLTT